MDRRFVLGFISSCVVIAACGGPSAERGGQSQLMDQTFAGANKCNPKNHGRPFIIEWDATDQSSFQARAATDVVFVRYEGCDLTVLDGCSMDSVKGAFGSYKPVDWTTGQLESIDVANESDLVAKLPLGAAALGGRVHSGEKFHMEYYVSGTRSATREHAYRAALAKVPACAGATHFVYAYNLGAFALGSIANMKGEAGGSYFGFGAGGAHSSNTSADKKGGDLGSCRSDSAREIDRCKVPIRLTLREIENGDDPQTLATMAPETDQAANLAGRLQVEGKQQREATEHAKAAREKQTAKDGAGCLTELDIHDTLDPTPSSLSISPKGGDLAHVRATCLMLAGQCDAGRNMLSKVLDAQGSGEPAKIDDTLGEFCVGTTASLHDQFLHAFWVLEHGKTGARAISTAECQDAFATVERLREQLADDRLTRAYSLAGWKRAEAACVARGGDCALAEKIHYDADSGVDFAQQMKTLHISCEVSPTNVPSGAHSVLASRTVLSMGPGFRTGQALDCALYCMRRSTATAGCIDKDCYGSGGYMPERCKLNRTPACSDAYTRCSAQCGQDGVVVPHDRMWWTPMTKQCPHFATEDSCVKATNNVCQRHREMIAQWEFAFPCGDPVESEFR